MQPTSVVINYSLLQYVNQVLSATFDLLARKEETDMDRAALVALSALKAELDRANPKPVAGYPFSTFLTIQEFAVLQSEMKPGKHLHSYEGRLKIVTFDKDVKKSAVLFQGTVDDPEVLFRVGHWVCIIHQMNVQAFGENYKIDPDWDNRPNN